MTDPNGRFRLPPHPLPLRGLRRRCGRHRWSHCYCCCIRLPPGRHLRSKNTFYRLSEKRTITWVLITQAILRICRSPHYYCNLSCFIIDENNSSHLIFLFLLLVRFAFASNLVNLAQIGVVGNIAIGLDESDVIVGVVRTKIQQRSFCVDRRDHLQIIFASIFL